MNWFRSLIHKFQGCTGHVVTRWQGGFYYIGFKCSECGAVKGIHKGYLNKEEPTNIQDTEWQP